MTAVLDAAPLVALADGADRLHGDVRDVLRSEPGALILSPEVTAEVDCLLGRRLGPVARRAFLDDLAGGRFRVECLELEDYGTVSMVDRRYADLDVGLADLSVVVLARRFATRRIVTFDERHFRAIRPLQGGAFTLLPADAPGRPGPGG